MAWMSRVMVMWWIIGRLIRRIIRWRLWAMGGLRLAGGLRAVGLADNRSAGD
jgi:hypothetical protein